MIQNLFYENLYKFLFNILNNFKIKNLNYYLLYK